MDGEVTVKARKKMDWSRWRIILVLADQKGAKWSAGELPRFGSDDNGTDDEERPDNSENLLLELFAWRKSARSHCRAISRWTSCSCLWTTDSKAKVEVWHSFCYSLDLFWSGFEVGVGHQLQEYFLCRVCLSRSPKQLHRNRKVWERISRFSRCCSRR